MQPENRGWENFIGEFKEAWDESRLKDNSPIIRNNWSWKEEHNRVYILYYNGSNIKACMSVFDFKATDVRVKDFLVDLLPFYKDYFSGRIDFIKGFRVEEYK
jgi:hypothetical protein